MLKPYITSPVILPQTSHMYSINFQNYSYKIKRIWQIKYLINVIGSRFHNAIPRQYLKIKMKQN